MRAVRELWLTSALVGAERRLVVLWSPGRRKIAWDRAGASTGARAEPGLGCAITWLVAIG